MKAHTPAEAEFAIAFGDALRPHYVKAKRERKLNRLARDLGVTAPALDKYLDGETMPGLNTVVLAYRRLGVAVPFEGVDLTKLVDDRKKPVKKTSEVQIELPLTIHAPRGRKFDMRLHPTGFNQFELELKFAQKRG